MNRHSLARFLRRWHARLGVATALFFMVLIVTGVALNHTDRLGLAHIPVQSEAMTRWYGLPPPQIVAVYEAGEFIATPTVWLYRGQRLPESTGGVVGVARTPDMLAVATAQTLSLYTGQGERIDLLQGTALPALPITGLGRTENAIALKTPKGVFASSDGIGWLAIPEERITWSQPQAPTPQTLARVSRQLAPNIPLERVLLDLHSGRLLGRYGPLLMDAAALILLLLSLSGLWIQWRSWQQKRRHPHKI